MAATLFTAYTATSAIADHEPAMKAGATGSDVDTVGEDQVILSETMRVSSPEDVIVQVTAECSIITELTTNNDNPASSAFGAVRLRVQIDGIPVPVALDESDASADDAADDDNEVGEVTFCNRAYGREVTDQEDDDGQDQESDYIRTRTANAFNWIAFDTGFVYDVGNDNIITVELIADYDVSQAGDAIADAFVGSRTMIIEPIRVSNHEQVAPVEADSSREKGNRKP
ncbi:MAG TPA: hypothetical protein VG929_01920 [Actinomycetota bacterium]|nr:hypothetical protein [Actinomycetota bacterium]